MTEVDNLVIVCCWTLWQPIPNVPGLFSTQSDSEIECGLFMLQGEAASVAKTREASGKPRPATGAPAAVSPFSQVQSLIVCSYSVTKFDLLYKVGKTLTTSKLVPVLRFTNPG